MYGNAHPVLGLQYRNTANDVLASFNYTLDTSGNRIAVDDHEGHSDFGYDQLDRLVSASYPDGASESFEMDLSGNRIRHTDADGVTEYVLDQGDRLLSTTGAKPATYTWDDNGNMASKETPDGTTVYTWDSRDKLVQVDLPTGATNRYSYYPLSDLRLKTVDQAGEEKFFLYDKQNVLEELDPYNGSLARYVEGVGVDEHIARVENGQVHAYVGDPLGTVRAVVDAGGNVVNQYAYRVYGGFRSRSESVENPYKFTGRRFDADTGEYYYRARYYQPGLGRFSAVDPFAPEEASFEYAEANPLLRNDPLGRQPAELLERIVPSNPRVVHDATLPSLILLAVVAHQSMTMWPQLLGLHDPAELDKKTDERQANRLWEKHGAKLGCPGLDLLTPRTCENFLSFLERLAAESSRRLRQARAIGRHNNRVYFYPNEQIIGKKGDWHIAWRKLQLLFKNVRDQVRFACNSANTDQQKRLERLEEDMNRMLKFRGTKGAPPEGIETLERHKWPSFTSIESKK